MNVIKLKKKVNKFIKVIIVYICFVIFVNIVIKCDDLFGNIFIKYIKYIFN